MQKCLYSNSSPSQFTIIIWVTCLRCVDSEKMGSFQFYKLWSTLCHELIAQLSIINQSKCRQNETFSVSLYSLLSHLFLFSFIQWKWRCGKEKEKDVGTNGEVWNRVKWRGMIIFFLLGREIRVIWSSKNSFSGSYGMKQSWVLSSKGQKSKVE